MKFTFIYLISTIECMYIVHSFAIGAVAEVQKRVGATPGIPKWSGPPPPLANPAAPQSQKCSY